MKKMLRFLNMLGKCVLDRIGVMRYFVACEQINKCYVCKCWRDLNSEC